MNDGLFLMEVAKEDVKTEVGQIAPPQYLNKGVTLVLLRGTINGIK